MRDGVWQTFWREKTQPRQRAAVLRMREWALADLLARENPAPAESGGAVSKYFYNFILFLKLFILKIA